MDRAFGRYRVLETIGSGGMGDVHRARDEMLARDVAIKTLRNVAGLQAEMFRARFTVEARALAALSHQGIIPIYDLGIEGDEPYLVMELIDGPSLKELLAKAPLPAAQVSAMGIQIARALEAAHKTGILHRDVKPANILRSSTGEWKLADFGIARVPDSDLTVGGQFLGSPAYAAPEALAFGMFSDKADVFGLAMTMAEALTGRKLRGDATLSEMARQPDDAVDLPFDVPPQVAGAVRIGLARDPGTRPTAARFAEMLAGTAPAPIVTAASTASLATETAVLGPPRRPTPLPTPVPSPSMSFSTPASTVSIAPPPPDRRTLKIGAMVVGGLVLVGVVAALFAGGGKGTPTSASSTRAAPAPASTRPVVPGKITVVFPAGIDRKGAEKYAKIIDALQDGELDEAYEKLDEFEDKYGASPESRHLRAQLDAMPE